MRFLEILTKNRIRYILDPEKRISEYCKENKVDICYCSAYGNTYYNIENEVPIIMEPCTPNIKHPDFSKEVGI